jgi:hypothetical protein
MKSPVARKVGRVLYYLRNLTRDVAPQLIFRRRLDAILAGAGTYDARCLAERVDYYNKLFEPVAAEPGSSTVGSIAMAPSMYYYDLKEHARYFPRHLKLNHLFGDIRQVPERPSIVKSRPIGGDNRNAVLMKLDKFRHFYIPADQTAFADKKPIAVWRGSVANQRRRALLAGYRDHPLCDVGAVGRSTGVEGRKPFLPPSGQMRFRYVISIEGNDVATNLKWILASNSLCLMPAPRCETWFMEGRLESGGHYAELRDDFADLEEKILHYERHPDEALGIIRNANRHVAQFLDERREQLISLLVLYKYFVKTGQLDIDPRVAGLIGGPR